MKYSVFFLAVSMLPVWSQPDRNMNESLESTELEKAVKKEADKFTWKMIGGELLKVRVDPESPAPQSSLYQSTPASQLHQIPATTSNASIPEIKWRIEDGKLVKEEVDNSSIKDKPRKDLLRLHAAPRPTYTRPRFEGAKLNKPDVIFVPVHDASYDKAIERQLFSD